MDPLKIYDYLLQTRQHVRDTVRLLTSREYLQPFAFGLQTIGSTLTHLMTSEWYYIERVEGRAVPPYEQWPIHYETPPPFDVVEATWREQERRVRRSIAALFGRESGEGFSRVVEYDSFPDEQGRRFHVTATVGDFLAQLALHEVHHRAQLMVMLRSVGRPVQDIDYNDLTFKRHPITSR